MKAFRSKRPFPSEFKPFYADYVACVPDGDITRFLALQQQSFIKLLDGIPENRLDYRYAPRKWTTREVVGHVIDTEWVFGYRTLRMARGDKTALAGMDQNAFISGANFSSRTIESLRTEFEGLRTASLTLVSSFTEEIFDRTGTASGSQFSVRSLVWIMAGHCQHHINVLKQRYV